MNWICNIFYSLHKGFSVNKLKNEQSFPIILEKILSVRVLPVWIYETPSALAFATNKGVEQPVKNKKDKIIVIFFTNYFFDPPDPQYNPNHAAPAPTITDINALCALVGSGNDINHSVVL